MDMTAFAFLSFVWPNKNINRKGRQGKQLKLISNAIQSYSSKNNLSQVLALMH
jgi:hypothetical protein